MQEGELLRKKWKDVVAQMVKTPPANAGGFDPCQEDLLGEEVATHSSILVWRIPWTEKPGGLQSMESKKGK